MSANYAPPGASNLVTSDDMDAMERAAKAGGRWRHVAEAGGVEWGTFKRWMTEGRRPGDPAEAFAIRLTRARAEGRTALLERMETLSTEGSERALIWLLERVHGYAGPDPDEADVSGDTVKVDTPLDRIAAAFDRMMARKAEPGA